MAGNDAVISSELWRARSTVSTNTCTVMKLWLTTRGAASTSNSRLPPAEAEASHAGNGVLSDSRGRTDSAASTRTSLRIAYLRSATRYVVDDTPAGLRVRS